MGVRTVFNLLGPLTNPAAPPFLVAGAYSEAAARLMAETLSGMDIERAFVIHGAQGWDEATPVGPFVLFDVRQGAVQRVVRDPAEFGVARCQADELRGGDAVENAARLRVALSGGRGADRNAIVLGAALALEVTGREPSLGRGLEAAEQAIDNGAAAALLDDLAGPFSKPHEEAISA
jgi:anthranilate phosphoribosyltransferase